MPLYNYTYRNDAGALIKRKVRGLSEEGIQKLLDSLGYEVESLELHDTAFIRFNRTYLDKYRRVSSQDLILFTKQLATMVRSGMTILRGLEAVHDQSEEPFRERIGRLIEDLKGGMSFSESLASQPDVFAPVMINMVRAGEASGMLDDTLAQLSDLGIHELEIRTKVKSAVMYPIVVLFMALCMVTFLLVKVVPKISRIFASKGAELPLLTEILLAVSGFIISYWPLILLVIGGGYIAIKNWLSKPEGQLLKDKIVLGLPIFGPLILKVLISRYCRVLGSLVKAGVTITDALTIVGGVVENRVMQEVNEEVKSAVIRGLPLSDVFQGTGLFPIMVIQMMRVGEESGNMDAMLFQVADFYDLETDYTISNLTSMLEPIILIAVGFVVGTIAFAILLPIFQMSKVISGG